VTPVKPVAPKNLVTLEKTVTPEKNGETGKSVHRFFFQEDAGVSVYKKNCF